MKLTARIIKIRAVKRESYGNDGITFVFSSERGELTRTYNIQPKHSTRSKLIALLNQFQITPPYSIIDKPILFCLRLEELLKETECELVVLDSGNPKFPFNIESIKPILTSVNKYSTSQNQETFSSGEPSDR